jgi:hypothetical protein
LRSAHLLHCPTLREYLVARELVGRGEAAVAEWVGRWRRSVEGDAAGGRGAEAHGRRGPDNHDAGDAGRWGEVFSLVCGLLGEGAAPYLDVLRAADEGLLRRTLPTIDGLPAGLASAAELFAKCWVMEQIHNCRTNFGFLIIHIENKTGLIVFNTLLHPTTFTRNNRQSNGGGFQKHQTKPFFLSIIRMCEEDKNVCQMIVQI